MSAILYRGSTCRIKFTPRGGVHVDDLGEPSIAIYQENLYLPLDNVTVDSQNNCIYADLSQEDTLLIAEGLETSAQAAYSKPDGTVYRFPVHRLDVRRTLMWTIDTGEEEEEEEETPTP